MNKEGKAVNNQHKSIFVVIILICGIAIIGLQAIKTTYDNDIWWLLETGREIIENGIPKTNPWAIHENMGIVIQQWIPSVILFLIHKVGSFPGLEVMLVIQIVILVLVLFRLGVFLTDNRNHEAILLVILISLISLSTYFSSRPQIYTMIFYSCLILCLEEYRVKRERKYLYILPVITLIHVNFHASMAPFDMFIIALYLIPDLPGLLNRKIPAFKKIVFDQSDYDRKFLFIAFIAASFALLINPYGLKGAAYLIESFGAAGYRDFINEMGETHITSYSGFADIVLIILGSMMIGKNGRRIDFPLTLLFLATAFLSMTHERNIWLVALFSIPLIIKGIKDVDLSLPRINIINKRPVYIVFAFCVIDFLLIYSYANIWPTMVYYIDLSKTDTIDYPQQACDWLDEFASLNDIKQREIRLFNHFNNGGLLEYRGYLVTMDQRPELWEPAITGIETHYYQEFIDFYSGDTPLEEYMGKYDWDFYIVRHDALVEKYMEEHPDTYQEVKKCNGYSLWGEKDDLVNKLMPVEEVK